MNTLSTLLNASLTHMGVDTDNFIVYIITEVIAFIISLFTEE
jgi:hypothetical protein